jgi:hypothetical protein
MMPIIAAAIPETPLAARRAGFVCLGDVLVDQNGGALVGVTPAQDSAPRGDAALLGLGEIRPAEGTATMVAIVDMSMNPFGVSEGRADRGHFVFSASGQTTNFYGVLNGGELRHTLARIAQRVHDGAAPLASASPN